jgi:hypothetical protein
MVPENPRAASGVYTSTLVAVCTGCTLLSLPSVMVRVFCPSKWMVDHPDVLPFLQPTMLPPKVALLLK